jgi:SAM-dependent methyltransferase|tara:strand:+ start:3176 stop:3970 length:795 start_codon:yes stop_codon:yes gene_type:complete
VNTDHIKRSTGAGWDMMSEWYQRSSEIALDDVHYAPYAPGERELNLLGPVKGKRVLELACGAAQNSIALSRWGATVVGVDISPNQLRRARELQTETGADVNLLMGDMELPRMFKPNSFDIVLSSFGWEFIPDLSVCFHECYALLKSGGVMIVATAHPLNAFVWDEDQQAVLVTDYFNPPVEVWADSIPDGHDPGTTFFHTFEGMFGLLTAEGFRIDKVLEPFPNMLPESGDDGAAKSPYAGPYWDESRDRLLKAPFAIVYVASK